MRQLDVQSPAKTSDDRLTPFSRGRRALVGSMAAFGAGLASSVMVPTDMMAMSSALLGKGDVALGISHTGASRDVGTGDPRSFVADCVCGTSRALDETRHGGCPYASFGRRGPCR